MLLINLLSNMFYSKYRMGANTDKFLCCIQNPPLSDRYKIKKFTHCKPINIRYRIQSHWAIKIMYVWLPASKIFCQWVKKASYFFVCTGKELVDYISHYLNTVRERRVNPNVQPGYMRALLPDSAPVESESWDNIFRDIEEIIMPGVMYCYTELYIL